MNGIYASSPTANLSDIDVEPGRVAHLVPGNSARLRDARRTPVTVMAVQTQIAMFSVRVDAFEDRGAVWHLPVREVAALDFKPHSHKLLSPKRSGELTRVDRTYPVHVAVRKPSARVSRNTEFAIKTARDSARAFLASARKPDSLAIQSRRGNARLQELMTRFMTTVGCERIETEIARKWASNPHAHESVKAHMIVMARIGLGRYDAAPLRDRTTLLGPGTSWHRRRHIVHRIGFVGAMFEHYGFGTVQLWRGLTVAGSGLRKTSWPLVSATFSRRVAQEHFASERSDQTGAALYRNCVPVSRLFMTYVETAHLNEPFREAEAVVVADPAALF